MPLLLPSLAESQPNLLHIYHTMIVDVDNSEGDRHFIDQ